MLEADFKMIILTLGAVSTKLVGQKDRKSAPGIEKIQWSAQDKVPCWRIALITDRQEQTYQQMLRDVRPTARWQLPSTTRPIWGA